MPPNEDTGEAKDLDAVPPFPALFKHMVVAIFLEGRLSRQRRANSRNNIPVRSAPNKDGFDSTKFLAAMDVALAQLKKYKMISENSSQEAINLTAYGRQRDNVHRKEGNSLVKIRRFDKYYTLLVNEGRRRVSKRPIKDNKPEKSDASDIFG